MKPTTGDAEALVALLDHLETLTQKIRAAITTDHRDARLERARRQFRLTRRQRDVVELVVAGATNRSIAEILGISERTVEVHLTSIYERAGVENRASLVAQVLGAA